MLILPTCVLAFEGDGLEGYAVLWVVDWVEDGWSRIDRSRCKSLIIEEAALMRG